MISKLKAIAYGLIYHVYDFVGWLATLKSRKISHAKKLLIVRVDEIGDYVLWRNFLNEIATADRFAGYEVYFCGNTAFKNLFELLDNKYVHRTYWIDKAKFSKSLRYRYSFLQDIYNQNFDIVINPTFSRDRIFDDTIVRSAKAKNAIGLKSKGVKPIINRYKGIYDDLFVHDEAPIFDFFRNKLFTEYICAKTSSVNNTLINTQLLPDNILPFAEGYFVVFPGARGAYKIWPTDYFIQVCNYLYQTRGLTAVVCGGKGDAVYTKSFCEIYDNPFIDLTGKTTLTQLLKIFKDARCLISVDTGSVHLASAVGCTVFAVYNGSNYKRFGPYPESLAKNNFAIYPDEIESELKDAEIVLKKYQGTVNIPYANVSAEKMIDCIKQQTV